MEHTFGEEDEVRVQHEDEDTSFDQVRERLAKL